MAQLYFQNIKTGKKFKVVSISPDKTKITFQGNHGRFTEEYTKERFQKMGYVLVQEAAA